jgi:hypothetical protein
MKGKQIKIEDVLQKASLNSKLSCIKIFDIIKENSLPADEMAAAIDKARVKINACQMGLFGYQGGKNIPLAETVPEILQNKIMGNLENGKLTCAAAWNIASDLSIKKIEVASACEKLNIKISKCQLHAF